MSQYRTRVDLVVETLEQLGVLAAGQPPEVEDTARVDAELPSILSKLTALEIVYISDIGNIPVAFFNDLAKIVADLVKGKFGISGDKAAQLERDGLGMPPGSGAAALSLKIMQRGRPTYEPLRTVYV